MKKTIFTVAIAAIAAIAAPAQQTKDIDQLRIYINPGHGGWGSGDRPMGTIKHGDNSLGDTTAFFETNTNTWKGLATLQRLSEYGFKYDPTLNQCPAGTKDDGIRYGAARDMNNNLVMSHVKNGLSRDINEIAREVEANNFDIFLSIHSNAHVDGYATNYPALFIRGENKTESSPGSINVCKAIWPYAYANTHQNWSNYSMTNVALYYDIDFWNGDYAITNHANGNSVKGYYAVLRHTVPGTLCEGYFHTYQPARHRAMNQDVCRIEGEAYARGLADLLGAEKEKTGDLYGIVRDRHERFSHKYYTAPSTSLDAYKPLNNAVVTLYDAQRNKVAEYTTDDEFNGAFVFRNLAPGSYYINVSAEGYLPMEEEYEGPYTVTAANTIYPDVFLTSEGYEPPAVVYRDYEDENDSPIFGAAGSYALKAAVNDKEIPELEGTTVKRMIVRGNNIFVLAHDAQNQPVLALFDAKTLELKRMLSTAGCEGSHNNLSDIAVTADGVLIGTPTELNHSDESQVEAGETFGVLNVYRWDNDDKGDPAGDPRVWFTTSVTANFYRGVTGFTMAYTGTTEQGTMVLPSYSTYYNRKVWYNALSIVNEKLESSIFKTTTHTLMNMDDLGDDVTITISPLNSNSFIVNSSKVQPMSYSVLDYSAETTMGKNHINAAVARESYFKYAGHSYMVVSDLDNDGAHAGVRMMDITDGLNKPKAIGTANTAMESHAAAAATAGRTVVKRNMDGDITSADINLYTLRGNKLSMFTTEGEAQPAVRGNYAYNLRAVRNAETYDLSFDLTGDADITVNLLPLNEDAEGAVPMQVANGAYKKGENTVQVWADELAECDYTWQVTVENEAVPSVSVLGVTNYRASGVAIDRNTDSPNYGMAYVAQYGTYDADGNAKTERGIRFIDPTITCLNPSAVYLPGVWDLSVGASPWRLAMMPTGKLLISDWGDKQGGIYLYDPANPQSPRTNFFAGTVTPSSGEWKYNGATIGGSTSGLQVVGSGEDAKLITFQEDWPSDYELNLVTYNIGTAEQINFQPEQSDAFATISKYLANGNVDVVVRDKGMALGQVRGDGNNTEGVPVFVITDPEGKILYNSGRDMDSLTGGVGCIGLNDDASQFLVVSPDGYFNVCSLEWTPEFKLTPLYKFNSQMGGGFADKNSYQVAYDPAGNLYVASRAGFRVFSLPREASKVSTPAPASQIVSGTNSVRTIDNDNEGEARFYDLRGIECDGSSLAPGVYIRKAGTTATKVIVK